MSYFVMLKIFVIHLILVIIVGGSIYYDTIYHSGSDESLLLWAVFLAIDFPMSIIVMITSGPSVVGVPRFLLSYFHGSLIFRDVIWPGLVFQVVGVCNWILLIYLYKTFWVHRV